MTIIDSLSARIKIIYYLLEIFNANNVWIWKLNDLQTTALSIWSDDELMIWCNRRTYSLCHERPAYRVWVCLLLEEIDNVKWGDDPDPSLCRPDWNVFQVAWGQEQRLLPGTHVPILQSKYKVIISTRLEVKAPHKDYNVSKYLRFDLLTLNLIQFVLIIFTN